MKPVYTLIIVFGLFALASTLESFDGVNRYQACIQSGSHTVYTDMEADILETRCQAISGYNPE